MAAVDAPGRLVVTAEGGGNASSGRVEDAILLDHAEAAAKTAGPRRLVSVEAIPLDPDRVPVLQNLNWNVVRFSVAHGVLALLTIGVRTPSPSTERGLNQQPVLAIG